MQKEELYFKKYRHLRSVRSPAGLGGSAASPLSETGATSSSAASSTRPVAGAQQHLHCPPDDDCQVLPPARLSSGSGAGSGSSLRKSTSSAGSTSPAKTARTPPGTSGSGGGGRSGGVGTSGGRTSLQQPVVVGTPVSPATIHGRWSAISSRSTPTSPGSSAQKPRVPKSSYIRGHQHQQQQHPDRDPQQNLSRAAEAGEKPGTPLSKMMVKAGVTSPVAVDVAGRALSGKMKEPASSSSSSCEKSPKDAEDSSTQQETLSIASSSLNAGAATSSKTSTTSSSAVTTTAPGGRSSGSGMRSGGCVPKKAWRTRNSNSTSTVTPTGSPIGGDLPGCGGSSAGSVAAALAGSSPGPAEQLDRKRVAAETMGGEAPRPHDDNAALLLKEQLRKLEERIRKLEADKASLATDKANLEQKLAQAPVWVDEAFEMLKEAQFRFESLKPPLVRVKQDVPEPQLQFPPDLEAAYMHCGQRAMLTAGRLSCKTLSEGVDPAPLKELLSAVELLEARARSFAVEVAKKNETKSKWDESNKASTAPPDENGGRDSDSVQDSVADEQEQGGSVTTSTKSSSVAFDPDAAPPPTAPLLAYVPPPRILQAGGVGGGATTTSSAPPPFGAGAGLFPYLEYLDHERGDELETQLAAKKVKRCPGLDGADCPMRGRVVPMLRSGSNAERCATCHMKWKASKNIKPAAGKPVVQMIPSSGEKALEFRARRNTEQDEAGELQE